MEKIKRLIEQRARIWEQGKELLDRADSEGRELTAEEEQAWQRISAELSDHDSRIAELSDLAERNRRAEEMRERYAAATPAAKRQVDSDADKLRRVATGEARSVEFSWAEFRALTKGTATDGLELVPTGFLPQLNEHLIETAAIVGAGATVLRTASGEDLRIPKTTQYSAATIIAEGGTIGASDPQFAQVTLGAYKYGHLVEVSPELLEDSAIDLVAFLAAQGGRALGEAFGAHVATGTGTGQPNGIVTAATVGKTGATGQSGVPQPDELIDLKHSVIPPYRRRPTAVWVMSDVTLSAIRKKKDSNGQYLWQPGLREGDPDVLLGHRIVVDHNIADAALNAKSVLFGDLSGYYARFSGSVRIDRSDEFKFDSDAVVYRFLLRADGDLVDVNAVKTFQGAAT